MADKPKRLPRHRWTEREIAHAKDLMARACSPSEFRAALNCEGRKNENRYRALLAIIEEDGRLWLQSNRATQRVAQVTRIMADIAACRELISSDRVEVEESDSTKWGRSIKKTKLAKDTRAYADLAKLENQLTLLLGTQANAPQVIVQIQSELKATQNAMSAAIHRAVLDVLGKNHPKADELIDRFIGYVEEALRAVQSA